MQLLHRLLLHIYRFLLQSTATGTDLLANLYVGVDHPASQPSNDKQFPGERYSIIAILRHPF